MKITLEYEGVGGEVDAKRALNASAAYGVLQDFDNYLRGRLKHETLTEDVYKNLQEARDKLYEMLGLYNVDLWED